MYPVKITVIKSIPPLWVKDGQEYNIVNIDTMIAPVDGTKILNLASVSAVLTAATVVRICASLPTSPLMEQVITGCMAEQEGIRRVLHSFHAYHFLLA